LMVTVGWFANWIRVDVTYVMSGFFPMYMVSCGPSLRWAGCSCCDGCGSDMNEIAA
jgi:hypothetical protein